MMKFTRAWIATSCLGLIWLPHLLVAEEASGSLRERLRERRLNQTQPPQRGGAITRPGDYSRSLNHDGLVRKYLIHVPTQYDSNKPAPLVVALHGGGGNMQYQANDTNYGLISKSDATGYIVVFPNGHSRRKSGNLATWNAGNCCGASRDADVDDVGFIRAMIQNLKNELNIDSGRIYATGMSNGGLMSYRLACEMPQVFRAIAPVAGTDNTKVCKPSKSVSVLHIHAKNDSHVLFEGGAGPDAFKSAVNEFTSVPDSVAKWVGLNGCPSTSRRVLEKQGAYCDRYLPCRSGTEVQLCVTESGGHSWPGGQKRRGEAPSEAISATDLMWDFFERNAH